MPAAGLAPRRLHPVSPFVGALGLARRQFLPLLLALFAGRNVGPFPIVLGLILTVGVVISVLEYVRRTYGIEAGAVVVDEGVIVRRRRVVALERIQQVDAEAGLVQRLLGVVTLKLDTAGGGADADVTLSVVSRAEADRLRAFLRHAGAGVGLVAPHDEGKAEKAEEAEEDVLLRIPPAELALAGITSIPLLLVLTAFGPLTELFEERVDAVFGWIETTAEGRPPVAVAAVVIAALSALWLGGAALASILSYGGYTLTRRGRDLHVAYGVFNRREASMAIDRIQAVRVHENLVRRRLGRAALHIQSGAIVGEKTRLVVPLLPAAAVHDLVEVVLADVEVPAGALEPAPPAARRRALLRRMLPAGLAAAALVAVVPAMPAVAIAVLVVAVAAYDGELHYRGLGLGTTASVVVGRAGGLARETVIVPASRVQALRIRTSPFQRRARLATLELPIAGTGRTPTIHDQLELRLAQVAGAVLPVSAADERRQRAASGSRAD